MCEAESSCRPVEELLDRPVERILEYRAYLTDLLQCGRKAGVDTHDLEVKSLEVKIIRLLSFVDG